MSRRIEMEFPSGFAEGDLCRRRNHFDPVVLANIGSSIQGGFEMFRGAGLLALAAGAGIKTATWLLSKADSDFNEKVARRGEEEVSKSGE